MVLDINIRPARKEDARVLAELYRIAADGVADYIWSKQAEPGQDLLDVGAARYARESTAFSYQNFMVAETAGEVIGIMIGFPMHLDPDAEPEADPILRPFDQLEADNTFYVAGIAVHPDQRSEGLGTRLLDVAQDRAKELGYTQLSAIVFEQNRAFRLWQRLGFVEVERITTTAHPFFHYTGDAVLMVKDLENS